LLVLKKRQKYFSVVSSKKNIKEILSVVLSSIFNNGLKKERKSVLTYNVINWEILIANTKQIEERKRF